MKFSNLKLTTPCLEYEALFYHRVEPTSQNTAKLLGVNEDLNLDEKLLDIVNGRTIDYGPFAFLDDYVCNNRDQEGRYSFTRHFAKPCKLATMESKNIKLSCSS